MARAAFRVDLTAAMLAGLYAGAVFPFVTVIARKDLHASPEVLAFMTAAPFLGNLLALFWARAVEGRRKVPFVKWSHLGARLIIAGSAFAVGAWPFALVIGIAQIVGTIATPAYAAVIKEVYPDDQRGQLVSYTRAGILIAQVVSTLLAGVLLTAFGYRAVFPVAALIGIAAALTFGRIHPNEAVPPADPARRSILGGAADTGRFVLQTLSILRTDVPYRWFALSVFTYGFGNLLTVPVIPLIQVDVLRINEQQVSILAILTQGVAVLCYFYWGRWVDRHSPQKGVVINVLLNLLIPLNYILTAVWAPNAWVLLPASLLSGVVLAGIDMSYTNAVFQFSGPDNVARYQALQSFLLGLRGTLAPFLGGSAVGWLAAARLDMRWIFVVGLGMMLIGAWMQGVAIRRTAERSG